MKKSFLGIVLKTILAISILTSCNKTPKQLKYIPKEAVFVGSIDGKNIAMKTIDFKKLLSFDFTKNKEVKNDSLVDLFKNSGIDLLGKAYFFASPSKEDKFSFKIAAVVALDDAEDFAAMMAKEAKKHNYKFTDKGNIHYFDHESGISMAWNSEVLIAAVLVNKSGALSGKPVVQNLMALKEENSIVNNEKFLELQKKEADLTLWVNYECMDNYKELFTAYSSILGKDFSFKDTYVTSIVNFNNGNITAESESYVNKATQAKFGALMNQNINENFINQIPSKNLNGYFAFSLNLKQVSKLLKDMNLLSELDNALAKQGFTSSEVFDAFSGDILLSMNGTSKQEQERYNWETGTIEMKQVTMPNIAFSLGIGKKGNFDKIIAFFEKSLMLQKTAENQYTAMGKAFFTLKNNVFIAVSSQDMVKEISDPKSQTIDDENKKTLTSNAFVMDFNFTKIDTNLVGQFGKIASKSFTEQPIESFKITSTGIKDGYSKSQLVVNLKDKEKNSLTSLYEAILKAQKVFPNPTNLFESKKIKEEDLNANIDSVHVNY